LPKKKLENSIGVVVVVVVDDDDDDVNTHRDSHTHARTSPNTDHKVPLEQDRGTSKFLRAEVRGDRKC
jgi:hypothetical protein